MKKLIFVLMLLAYANLLNAQDVVGPLLDGSPARLIKNAEVIGSAFLADDWMPADVKNVKGQSFKDVKLKYDVLEEQVYFLGRSGEAMLFSIPLSEFSIRKRADDIQTFRSGFPLMDKNTDRSFYQVLVDGNAKLLKKYSKKITENRAYNSATVEKKIVDNVNYFIFEDGKLSSVKKDKKSLMSTLLKKDLVQKSLAASVMSIKKEEDLVKAIEIYNSL